MVFEKLFVCHRRYDTNNIKRYTELTPQQPFKDIVEWYYDGIESTFENADVNYTSIEYDLSTDNIYVLGDCCITLEVAQIINNELLENYGLKIITVYSKKTGEKTVDDSWVQVQEKQENDNMEDLKKIPMGWYYIEIVNDTFRCGNPLFTTIKNRS